MPKIPFTKKFPILESLRSEMLMQCLFARMSTEPKGTHAEMSIPKCLCQNVCAEMSLFKKWGAKANFKHAYWLKPDAFPTGSPNRTFEEFSCVTIILKQE